MKNAAQYVNVQILENGNAEVRINEGAAFAAGDMKFKPLVANPVWLHVEFIDGKWMLDDDDFSTFATRDEAVARAVELAVTENSR